jgi:phosphoribosylamine-glycine ligase
VFHAGTALNADGALVANGGRVLNVTARGPSVRAARDAAYAAVDRGLSRRLLPSRHRLARNRARD